MNNSSSVIGWSDTQMGSDRVRGSQLVSTGTMYKVQQVQNYGNDERQCPCVRWTWSAQCLG